MDNSLLISNSKLLNRRLRMNKLKTKTNIFQNTINIKTTNILEKSFNIKKGKKKNLFPSLSTNQVKYYTKSNSRASSAKEEIVSEKENKSFIKNKMYNPRKITLKLPDKFENIKKMRNNIIKREGNYFKTENNQKIIFNNIGINYHNKNNKRSSISSNKKDSYSFNKIEKSNDNEKILLIKNNKLEKEQEQKDNKIELLEKKIDKLINFIKNNETVNLKNKINELENEIELLKMENSKLKQELEIKNKIISTSTKDSSSTTNKKIIENKKDENNLIIKAGINDIDFEKLKKITIDPEDI